MKRTNSNLLIAFKSLEGNPVIKASNCDLIPLINSDTPASLTTLTPNFFAMAAPNLGSAQAKTPAVSLICFFNNFFKFDDNFPSTYRNENTLLKINTIAVASDKASAVLANFSNACNFNLYCKPFHEQSIQFVSAWSIREICFD